VTRVFVVAIAMIAIAAVPDRALAQTVGGRGHLELSAGGVWIGGVTLGTANATETSATLQNVPIFSTTSTVAAAPVVEGRIGWRLTRAFTVEAEGSLGHPELRIAASNDIENAPSIMAAERVEQFTVGGALLWYLPVRTRRAAPFVTGGGGYLRELHESATLVQTGRYYQFGGGVKIPLAERRGARLSALGIRVDARAIARVKGVAFDDAVHFAPAAGASFFVRF